MRLTLVPGRAIATAGVLVALVGWGGMASAEDASAPGRAEAGEKECCKKEEPRPGADPHAGHGAPGPRAEHGAPDPHRPPPHPGPGFDRHGWPPPPPGHPPRGFEPPHGRGPEGPDAHRPRPDAKRDRERAPKHRKHEGHGDRHRGPGRPEARPEHRPDGRIGERDGRMSREEFHALADRRFEALDRDRDGFVSPHEMRGRGRAFPGGSNARPGFGGRGAPGNGDRFAHPGFGRGPGERGFGFRPPHAPPPPPHPPHGPRF